MLETDDIIIYLNTVKKTQRKTQESSKHQLTRTECLQKLPFWPCYLGNKCRWSTCKALIVQVHALCNCQARSQGGGGQGGQLTPPLRTKGPLFGTSSVKLLRPITING